MKRSALLLTAMLAALAGVSESAYRTGAAEAAAEGDASAHVPFLMLTCGAIIVLAALALLAGCRRGASKAQEPRREAAPRAPHVPEAPPRQVPPAAAQPNRGAGAAASSLRVLQPATVRTTSQEALTCPECGALVECPASIRESDVICSSCRKAFRVH